MVLTLKDIMSSIYACLVFNSIVLGHITATYAKPVFLSTIITALG